MAISENHHPWAFTFGILGNIVSILVYLAPLPTFLRIYRMRSTMGFQSVPYVTALFSAMLWLYYAFLKTNAPLLVSINSLGCVVESFYIVVYLYYASAGSRWSTAKLVGVMNVGVFGVVFVITFLTPLIKTHETRVIAVGWICVGVSVCVFAAPLSILLEVVRTKSVEFMPFPLSFFLTLSAVMWFAYGLFERDLCVAVPNVIGFVLGVVQMVVYGVFRSKLGHKMKKPLKEEATDHEMDENKEGEVEPVLSILVLGTPEVHPVVGVLIQDSGTSSFKMEEIKIINNKSKSENEEEREEEEEEEGEEKERR